MGVEPLTRKRSISRVESSNTALAGITAKISNSIFAGTDLPALNYTNISDYKVNRHLGQGAYAIVKEGIHK